jgi:hypothetical protein
MMGLVLGLWLVAPVHARPMAAVDDPAQDLKMYGVPVTARPHAPTAMALRIGRPDTLDELVDRLLLAVSDLSSRRARVEHPVITRISLAELHRKLCRGPCTIRAAYVPGEGLFVDDTMRPDVNPYHQSILFHELVHHVQEITETSATRDTCNIWRMREAEAYALQNRFLAALGVPQQVYNPGKSCAPHGRDRVQTFVDE